ETLDAALQPQPLINASPPFEVSARLSGDGHHVHVLPTGFLRPGTDYRVRIAGGWRAGASSTGQADSTLRFRTERSRGPLPLTVTRNRVSALVMSRLAIPLPTLLPSVNQIGFDSYDWIVGTLAKSPPDAGGEGSLLLWVVGSRKDGRGVRAADPRSSFAFPLAGRYKRDSFAVSQRGVPLTFSFGEVPLRRLDLRGQLTRSMSTLGAGLYGEVFCPEVPVYGGGLELLGLCNRDRILVSTGTFITRAYEGRGRANVRPQGLSVRGVRLERPSAMQAGAVSATFGLARGARYRARSHVVAVLLTDGATGAPLSLDVKKNTRVSADRRGNLTSVRLRLPAGTQLPQRITAYVVTDAFPLAVREL
ncbi:MAG TPA: hypothetical protein VEQ61_06725, partial [Thermoleophilaceae bacterium]|nr:hypothetical protein [Thermoleophilaceae bacterium]